MKILAITQKIWNYNDVNKLVKVKVKDETCGVPLKAFLELTSKMYTFET